MPSRLFHTYIHTYIHKYIHHREYGVCNGKAESAPPAISPTVGVAPCDMDQYKFCEDLRKECVGEGGDAVGCVQLYSACLKGVECTQV
jgi:hypothetical protein